MYMKPSSTSGVASNASLPAVPPIATAKASLRFFILRLGIDQPFVGDLGRLQAGGVGEQRECGWRRGVFHFHCRCSLVPDCRVGKGAREQRLVFDLARSRAPCPPCGGGVVGTARKSAPLPTLRST